MSFDLCEIAYLRRHAHEISALNLEMSKKTQLDDVAKLRARFGGHGRAVAELIKARRSAAGYGIACRSVSCEPFG